MENKVIYESPSVEVIEISVEKGFATSGEPNEQYNMQPW